MGNPILGKEVGAAVKDGVVTVRYVGKYVDGRTRTHTYAQPASLCSYASQASKRKG